MGGLVGQIVRGIVVELQTFAWREAKRNKAKFHYSAAPISALSQMLARLYDMKRLNLHWQN